MLVGLMPATILANGISHLANTPDLRDVTTMKRLLETMGILVSSVDQTMTIDTTLISSYEAPYEHVKEMRASIYVLGPWWQDSVRRKFHSLAAAHGDRVQ